jgi:DnaA family protein
MHPHPQLPLALETAPSVSFDSFHVDATTRLVRDSVRGFVDGTLDELQIYLWGEKGTGKTHLLTAACQSFSQKGYRVAYMPGEMINLTGALEGLEQCDLVCIDDVQRLDHAAEVDLFHCINRCRHLETRMILAADRSPAQLGLKLLDLQTRLAWGLVCHTMVMSDEGLREAFRREIEFRSLEASDEVLRYVLRRFPRRMAALKAVVDTLDAVSLSEQRRITIPFVKSVFGDAERAALAERQR